MDQDAVEYYRRMLDDVSYLREALCVTYATGLDSAALIRAFGGDPDATMSRRELGDLLSHHHYSEVPPAMLVAEIGRWQIALELNGYQGTRPEVLRGAAAGGEAVSVYWNVNANNALTYAVGGRTRFRFDLMSAADRSGPAAAELDALLAGLSFDVDWRAAGLAVAERITGLRLPADLPSWDLPGVILEEIPQDLVPEGADGRTAVQDPFLQQVIAAPTLDKMPAIAEFLARLIVQDAGLAGEPPVGEVMAALAIGQPPRPELRAVLTALRDRYFERSRATTGWDRADLFRQGHAVDAFVNVAFPGRHPLDRVDIGGYPFRDADRQLQARILCRCVSRAVADARTA
ncbi:hypothetical protein BJY16_006418 [Actinoplanes octamycinicus]|uniref:Uncharacterized protein n=1 Tax=Actinoplanes octamycinicus TaxID=135948 RepID=A0A7W7H2U8_9ACTN|nr:DUF6461 domain-containing protein [Actinoplanes octamycinicus]MBB4742959.1 hypothetical protein [Actinoplanes octamycinicus]